MFWLKIAFKMIEKTHFLFKLVGMIFKWVFFADILFVYLLNVKEIVLV